MNSLNSGMKRFLGCVFLVMALSGQTLAQTDDKEISLRILPRVISTNSVPLRLGFRTGLLEGPGTPMRAECFSDEGIGAEGRVSVRKVTDADSGRLRFIVANTDERTRGVVLTTRTLRRRVGYTVRLRCRRVEGRGELRFMFSPVGGLPEATIGTRVALRANESAEKVFAVTPRKSGTYRCAFEIEPGSVMEFSDFSMLPEDAEAGWNHQVLEALRTVNPGTLRWPDVPGLGFYNWYDGVGPRAVRRAVSPTARMQDGHDFGTAEFIGFSRLIGAEPVLRVTVYQTGMKDKRIADLSAGAQLAADWVAYCNVTGGHPLAKLRVRHGEVAPLRVSYWELVAPDGGVPDARTCGVYMTAMRAEDPSITVDVGIPFLEPVRDRYVRQVMQRLSQGEAEASRYYCEWYSALGMAYAAVERLRRGEGGAVSTQFFPEQVLYRVSDAKHMLTEAGLLMTMFNRFPACTALVTEGASEESGAPFRVQAAWTEDDTVLVVFIYNARPEARTVRLDLTGLKRRFGFWIADQLAADITARRASQAMPVNRIQKAGAANTQVVLCEVAPSSFTRVLVKE